MNTLYKAYTIITLVAAAMFCVYTLGMDRGEFKTLERIHYTLEGEIKKGHVGGTFDAIHEEFEGQLP